MNQMMITKVVDAAEEMDSPSSDLTKTTETIVKDLINHDDI